ncbi:MAG: Glyoxalase/bleomycin resistance protein/dioxygenase [Noviherbaspirillum sp.]|jgi:catechol 2,3-dioxygenase-like lactoylglutathione lyase family enzyme|nr:Glyoxalase/bleomycin resistance protein/dioxygenase [Noviherbaspirillum sp.]
MATKINHVAIVSDCYAVVGKFYEALFGFKSPTSRKLFNAVTVGDGYVGININPRRPGRPSGLDHFGVEVDEVPEIFDRLKSHYPAIKALQRPTNRPFAGITTHDPDGNVFDLSQKDMKNRGEIYLENEAGWTQLRTVRHFAMRTMNPERVAEFYVTVLGLTLMDRTDQDAGYRVTDGRMTLAVLPWDIERYQGTGIIRPGPDHLGFGVENLDAFKADLERVAGENPSLMPKQIALGPEGRARSEMISRDNPGAFVMSDVDNVTLSVSVVG